MAPKNRSKYNPDFPRQCFVACKKGFTDKDLGELFDVSDTAIHQWAKKHPEFGEARKSGKDIWDDEVVRAARQSAIGGYTLTKEKVLADGTVIQYKEEQKADPRAQEYWLSSRRPDEWNPKKKIEHTGNKENPLAFVLGEIAKEAEDESITKD